MSWAIRPHGEIFLHVYDVYDDEFSLCEAIFFFGGGDGKSAQGSRLWILHWMAFVVLLYM